MLTDYTPEQIGETHVSPINARTKGRHSLVLVQPRSNTQVAVLEPCDWDAGRERVLAMVARGVDPRDMYCVVRPDGCLDTDGLPMSSLSRLLWWTREDQAAWEARQ